MSQAKILKPYLEWFIDMISIILVNWNSGQQLINSITSIEKFHNGLVKEVIIIDNASYDISLQQVLDYKSLNFKLNVIVNQKNQGFAAACNQGAALATADFYLFLNPDTELYQNSLKVPFDFLKQQTNVDVGIVGIQLVDSNGIVTRSCAKFPNFSMFFAQIFGLHRFERFNFLSHFMSDWDHLDTRMVDHVIGAFYFIDSTVFKQLDGFDEKFFVYLEDLDLSLRAKRIGKSTFFLSEAQAFHEGGGTSYQVKDRRLFYSLRSKILYSFKHFSMFEAWTILFCVLTFELFTRLGFAALRLSKEDFVNTLRGFIMLYADLPNILRVMLRDNSLS